MEHKFDMEPHSENLGEYGKLCRERTNKAMIKTRQILVRSFYMFVVYMILYFSCHADLKCFLLR